MARKGATMDGDSTTTLESIDMTDPAYLLEQKWWHAINEPKNLN
jgi:hypothetical protein